MGSREGEGEGGGRVGRREDGDGERAVGPEREE